MKKDEKKIVLFVFLKLSEVKRKYKAINTKAVRGMSK